MPVRLWPCHVLPLLITLAALAAAPARAQTPPFTQVVVFGDSLSDDGNVADVTQGAYGVRFPGPDFNYADGRFTDDTATSPASSVPAGVWHEQLTALFPGLPRATASLDGGTDHAYGDATTAGGTTTISEGAGVTVTVDNVGKQVSDTLAAAAGQADPGALYVVWGGANDLLNDDSASSVTATATRVGNLVRQLGAAGAHSLLVPNVPPLGDLPDQSGNATQAAALNQASSSYRDQLNAALDSAQSYFTTNGLTVKIYRLDVFGLFTQVSSDPAAHGFTNVTESAQGQAVNADQYLFWDGLHPTVAGHAQIAAAAYDLVFGAAGHALWTNPDGKTIVWNVNPDGSHAITGTYGPFADDASGNTDWTAVSLSTGAGGVSHLLWTNPDGNTCLWTVQADGSHIDFFYGPFEDDGTANTIWKPVAVSTGGDNVTHVLWTNPDGRTILWDVSPTDGAFTVVGDYDPQPGYTPAALASGPDGLSHVLWNGPNGQTLLWDLDANNQPTAHAYGPFSDDGTANTLWQARAVSVGPDGVPHLLWTNPDGRTILWNVNADGTFAITGNYGPFQDDASGNTSYTAVALATGGDGLSHFAWDNPDGNSYLWSVQPNGGFTPTFYPPFYDVSSVWKAVAVSAAVPAAPH